jgi:hypothetical protein
LVALALLAYWGAVVGTGAWAYALAVLAPIAMIVVWARYAAPRSPRRLATPARMALELGIFALAAAAGYGAGAHAVAGAFAAVAAVNAVGLVALSRWADPPS